MGLFGPSKREIMLTNENTSLRAEVARLTRLLSPEQQQIELLNSEIIKLQSSIADKAANISQLFNRENELKKQIENLNISISEKQKQISVLK